MSTNPPQAFAPVQPYRLQEITLTLRRTDGPTIQACSTEQIAAAFRHLEHDVRESLYALYLDPANTVILYERVSTGTLTHTAADPAEIARTALLVAAYAVILLHNHPAGTPTPSPDDHQLTQQVANALALFNVALGDHVIIGPQGSYYSFYEHGEVPKPLLPARPTDPRPTIYTVSWLTPGPPPRLVVEHALLTPRQAAALERHFTELSQAQKLFALSVEPIRAAPLSCKALLRRYPVLRPTPNRSLPLEIP